jgi:uncharacterized protein (DUF433 family)
MDCADLFVNPTNESVGYCHSSAAQTKLCVMNSSDLITLDPEILGGTPVFRGTRVPVNTLFEYLENDYSLEEFLECFPSVSRDLARQVLERSEAQWAAESEDRIDAFEQGKSPAVDGPTALKELRSSLGN